MKLYISADIEGVAGVASRAQSGPEQFEYELAREWMTGEVRAACEGAFDAGFSEIVISDSHGNGQNLLIDELPESVRIVRCWPRPLEMMEGIQEGGFSAAMLIGYHAGATNMEGNLAHTLYGLVIRSVKINGVIAPEAYISAATAGEYGVPVVLISGDDVFVRETRGFLTDVTAVTTKESVGTLSAKTITPASSCKLIRIAAKQALQNIAKFQPLVVETPVKLEVEFKHRLPAELLDFLPFITRLDAFTIEHTAASMSDVSRFLAFITNYQPTLV